MATITKIDFDLSELSNLLENAINKHGDNSDYKMLEDFFNKSSCNKSLEKRLEILQEATYLFQLIQDSDDPETEELYEAIYKYLELDF